MTMYELFDQSEIDIIIEALTKQEKFMRSVANKPIQGFGSQSEKEKKQEWANKADEVRNLLSKITDLTI